jgi:ketosteroid isomerase-like protein
MSQENVEVVRRIYAAMEETGSFAASGLLDAEVEWVNPSNAVEPGTRKGREAFDAAWFQIMDSFETVVFQPRDFLDTGDYVVLITVMRACGHRSGADVEHAQGHVWTIEKGKAVQMRWFNDPYLALEAAGLSEQDAHADS